MAFHRTLAVVAGIALAGAAGAEEHGEADASTVVATVNGEPITLGEMIIARAQLPAQYQALPDAVLFDGLLDQLVQQQLLAGALAEVPDRVAIALSVEERSLRAGEVINDLYEEALTEEAVQAAYEEQFLNATPTVEYDASHILVETEAEAEELLAELEAGADFATLAQERSTGPSGPNGGALGWFTPDRMVQPFSRAVVAMEVGDVAGPVQTQFGFHVIKLNDRRNQEAPALDAVRAQIESQIQEEALTARIEALTEAGDIVLPEAGQFDPALIGNLDLLGE